MTHAHAQTGYTLVEVLFALGVAATLAAAATPAFLTALDNYKALGAARYVSTRLQRARMQAVARYANTAIRFSPADDSYSYATYVDGNGDGVRSVDISGGIDRKTDPDERLPFQFGDVDFGTLPALPAVDPSSPPPGADPIRFGASDSVSFTPLGTATPGSLYIRGSRSAQYVVRVFGETGKTRILKFNPRASRWEPLQ